MRTTTYFWDTPEDFKKSGLTRAEWLIALASAVFAFASAPLQAALTLVIAPLAAAVAVLYWRFVCELFLLAFNTYERLGEIRDRLPAAQQYPQF